MNDLPKRPLDSFDQAILRMLQQDNKTSQRVIAEAIGLSTPAVQRRITQLEASGVILANTAVIAPEALGQELTAIVESRLCDDRSLVMDRAKRYFASVPEVQQCYFVSGGVSFIIVMLARNVAHFEKLVRQHFADNDDIQTYRTLIVLDKVKVGLEVAFQADAG
ncbi:Lrp/AsnC family transcriptional regulator [Pseudomonas sp. zfem004]|uniref:Lrp/AsnC family transcriptional regulator n=1 Tax=Pseudomonas sp. zfem004 TaxID=3078199 RepID=UPI0029292CA1|nr:Lrp/AsnC family transcriptional regulator [Pseudomonas sp. zfem004]MDU9402747.1 Lrp/AsnC family transcriptional regulator [Pseudomonas sp. zfem004]